MRTCKLTAMLLVALALAGCAAPAEAEEVALESEDQKTLYALGLVISRNLAGFDFTEEELARVQAGLADGALGREPRVTLETYGPRIQTLLEGRMKGIAEKHKATGAAFLAEAAGESGAIKLESGMVFKEVEAGSGATPAASDKVKVHYTGKLPDGTVFDSSLDGEDPKPVTFSLDQVIPCFSEGIQKMKVGGKSKLVCPPDLAYGDRGSPPAVPPGATLVFEIQLLEIVPAAGE